MREFIKDARFEFVNGGWSTNNEACPTFQDLIENMMVGHSWLFKEFGFVPKVGWLMDTAGHSSGNARLFSDMGLEALFVGQLDHKDLAKRSTEKSLNYLWRPFSKHFGNQH
jgi:hypothetical protein